MGRLWLVARHEYLNTIRRRGFLLFVFGVPLAIAVLAGLITLLPRLIPEPSGEVTVGYVDDAGFLASPLPDVVPPDEGLRARFLPYATSEQARTALEGGQIAAYFIIPAGYTATLQVEMAYMERPAHTIVGQFQLLLRTSLLAGRPPEVVRRALYGSSIKVYTPDGRPISAGTILGQMFPALAGVLIVLLVFFGSGRMMQAINDERANRTLEILETSISPNRLMAGKVLAVVGVNLTQFGVWGALAALAVLVAGAFPGTSWLQDIRVDPAQLALVAAILLPAYLLLAGLLTAVGTLIAEPRASEQISGLVIGLYSTLIGMMAPLLRLPDSPVAVGLTFFPLTTPVILPLRMAVSKVPSWQVALSIGLLVVSALGATWLAGRALRLSRLRYGQRLRLGELLGIRAARSPRHAGLAPRAAESARGRRPAGRPARGKVWTVLGFELRSGLTKPAYLIIPIGIPLLIFMQLGFSELAFSDQPLIDVSAGAGQSSPAAAPALQPQGYVDEGAWVRTLPPNVPPGLLLAFPDEESARRAMAAGQIAGYYVIPADYLASGEVAFVPAYFNPLVENLSPAAVMDWVLVVNLLDGDMALAARSWAWPEVQETVLTPDGEAGAAPEDDSMWTAILPMLIMLVIYMVILMSSNFLLRTVSEEKSNRIMEWMLVSLHPRQLLSGKTVAWGILGLLQAVLLAGVGYLLLLGMGKLPAVPTGFHLEPALLAWSVVFCLLGYAVYAGIAAGAGALIPHWREARGASFLFALPALLGFYVAMFSTDVPNGLLVTLASFFPLTAPFTMIFRMVLTEVPLWQSVLSCVLMVLATWAIGRSAAAMFRAQNLLSGQPFSIKRYLRALTGQE